MLIRRCAWHREFHGYVLIHGVASWRGLSVKFTDGVCRRCAARVRVEWHLGRVQTDSPLRYRLLASSEYRRVAVFAVFALLLATIIPTGSITDVLLGKAPERAPLTVEARDPRGVSVRAAAAVADPSREAESPRVSRHRPPPPPAVTVIRYRPPKPLGSPRPPVAIASSAMPGEVKRSEPARPQMATGAPLVLNVARISATEDELMSVARRHSVTRLLLAPPEERPRHAGLAVQAP
jgi:hypothetical protein